MSVERRYSKRYPISGAVYIRYRKQQAFPAKAVNGSLYGIYLRTESLTLLSGSLVELDIYLNGNHWQIVGIVTHCQRDGLGVMFLEAQREFYESSLATGVSAACPDPGIHATGLPENAFSGESIGE